MGTRCEIYVRTEGEDREGKTHRNVVELWKHWDGYPSGIKELFEDFAQFIRENVGDQPHRLFYAEDFSAMLIAFSFMESKAQNEKFGKPERECYPDIRPKGNIDDAEYYYIVSVESPTNKYSDAVIHVKVFGDNGGITSEMVKNGTEGFAQEEFDIPLALPGQSGLMVF